MGANEKFHTDQIRPESNIETKEYLFSLQEKRVLQSYIKSVHKSFDVLDYEIHYHEPERDAVISIDWIDSPFYRLDGQSSYLCRASIFVWVNGDLRFDSDCYCEPDSLTAMLIEMSKAIGGIVKKHL